MDAFCWAIPYCQKPPNEIDRPHHTDRNSDNGNERPHDHIAMHGWVGAEADNKTGHHSREKAKKPTRKREPAPLALVRFEYADDSDNRRHGADAQHSPRCPQATRRILAAMPVARTSK